MDFLVLSPPCAHSRWRQFYHQFARALTRVSQPIKIVLNLLELHLHLHKLSNCRQNAIEATDVMDLQRILNTPSRGPSSEVLDTPSIPTPPSQATAQSLDSQNGPCLGTSVQETQDSQSYFSQSTDSSLAPSTPNCHRHSDETSRDLRLMIQTALLFKRPYKEICQVLGVTENQIRWAKTHRLTPQKARRLRPKLRTPQRRRLEEWLLVSPSHRR